MTKGPKGDACKHATRVVEAKQARGPVPSSRLRPSTLASLSRRGPTAIPIGRLYCEPSRRESSAQCVCVCMYVCRDSWPRGARVAFNNPYLTRVQGGLGVSHASMRFRVYPLEGVKMGGGKPLMETRAVSRAWVCMQRKAPGNSSTDCSYRYNHP